MLQMTKKPNGTFIPLKTGPDMSDVVARVKARVTAGDLTVSTGASYVSAVESLAQRANLPLGSIAATQARIDSILPMDGFDTEHEQTETAYQLKRRRVNAALKEYLGVHAALKHLRAQRDEWSELFVILEPYTEQRDDHDFWHPMKLAAMKSFALVARAHHWQPRDLNAARAKIIDDAYRENKREANRTCLTRLDDIRVFPDALPLLPPQPIGFIPSRRDEAKADLPAGWEATFLPWIDAVTKSGWDPVAQSHSDDHQAHARVMRAAIRCYLRIALEIGLISRSTTDITPIFSCADALRQIAGEMIARHKRTRADGHLAKRSSRKYLKAIRQVLDHLHVDTAILNQILKNNKDARAGAKAEKKMTQKNQRFCQSLLEKPVLKRRFLFSFRALREEAETVMARAKAEGREMTKHEIAHVRMLGACACFAAIEIGGAPIRVRNAMELTCTDDDAQIRIPQKGKKPMQVLIPAELTKNDEEIEFPIRANKHGCYETIRWYMQTIRPLFPHAASSPYLFPSIRIARRPMQTSRFGAKFSELMRTLVNLPMTPHQMRHGQTSLLLNTHPNELPAIAKRIGDKPDTLRIFYGWIDAVRLVEKGQDLLIGLME